MLRNLCANTFRMIFIIISDCLDICKGDLYRMLIIIHPSSEVSLYEKNFYKLNSISGHKVRVHHVVCYLNQSWNCFSFDNWTSHCWFQKGKVTLTFSAARVLYHSVEKKWSRHLRKKYSGYLFVMSILLQTHNISINYTLYL